MGKLGSENMMLIKSRNRGTHWVSVSALLTLLFLLQSTGTVYCQQEGSLQLTSLLGQPLHAQTDAGE